MSAPETTTPATTPEESSPEASKPPVTHTPPFMQLWSVIAFCSIVVLASVLDLGFGVSKDQHGLFRQRNWVRILANLQIISLEKGEKFSIAHITHHYDYYIFFSRIGVCGCLFKQMPSASEAVSRNNC